MFVCTQLVQLTAQTLSNVIAVNMTGTLDNSLLSRCVCKLHQTSDLSFDVYEDVNQSERSSVRSPIDNQSYWLAGISNVRIN